MASDMATDFASVLEHAPRFPLASSLRPRYGTAGFRGPAEMLQGVAFRCGIIVALRCYASKSDCGLIITASHNPVSDNGIKFVDFDGGLLSSQWEDYAERICQAESAESLVTVCQDICQRENIALFQRDAEPYKVFVGHDTRPSSPALLDVATKAIKALRIEIAFEPGLQTTPQVYRCLRNVGTPVVVV